jgi:acyl dehydratase
MGWDVGHAFEPQTYDVRRSDLVRYAGASGDFNPIHWSDRIATSVGLPGVIAHGMYTLALAGNAVVKWSGGPDRVLSFGARFTKPVVVPDDDTGTVVTVAGTVKSVEDGVATIDLTVTNADQKVLGISKATVRV